MITNVCKTFKLLSKTNLSFTLKLGSFKYHRCKAWFW